MTHPLATAFPGLHFEEARHRYTHQPTGRVLTSVTTFLKRFSEPFNADAQAARMEAQGKGVATELLAQWKRKADASRTLGTAVHAFIEHWWLAHGDAAMRAQLVGELTPKSPTAYRAFLDIYEQRLHALRPVGIEARIYDLEMGLAGTVDALLTDPSGDLWVLDWKTNGKFRTTTADTYGRRLLPPFDDLPHNELAEYSIQLSTYRLMLERAGIPTVGAVLAHLPPDGPAQLYPAYDLRERLADYFNALA